jgi:hypothetical protein
MQNLRHGRGLDIVALREPEQLQARQHLAFDAAEIAQPGPIHRALYEPAGERPNPPDDCRIDAEQFSRRWHT